MLRREGSDTADVVLDLCSLQSSGQGRWMTDHHGRVKRTLRKETTGTGGISRVT